MREARKSAEPADKPGSVVDSHSSRRRVTATLKQPTRTRHGPCHGVPIWPCSGWGLPCRSIAGLAVRSCRTVSPLPVPSAYGRPSAVCSLLHFPSARAAQALPGILPCGARTFLDAHTVHRDCLADSAARSVSPVPRTRRQRRARPSFNAHPRRHGFSAGSSSRHLGVRADRARRTRFGRYAIPARATASPTARYRRQSLAPHGCG